jgi:hypothetical protein
MFLPSSPGVALRSTPGYHRSPLRGCRGRIAGEALQVADGGEPALNSVNSAAKLNVAFNGKT